MFATWKETMLQDLPGTEGLGALAQQAKVGMHEAMQTATLPCKPLHQRFQATREQNVSRSVDTIMSRYHTG